MIVNEGGGKRKAYKNFTEPQERDQGKFNRHKRYPRTFPHPLGDKQQPVVHLVFWRPRMFTKFTELMTLGEKELMFSYDEETSPYRNIKPKRKKSKNKNKSKKILA